MIAHRIRAFFTLLCVSAACVAGANALAQTAADEPLAGDPVRGKVVFQRVGYCVNCHGWAGDGQSGRNPRSPDAGANLRETSLDTESLAQVIRCGFPGTQMPYHEGPAYKDGRCYGLTNADFEPGFEPIRGKTFTEKDVMNLVAYLQTHMIGLGKPTYEECADYFEKSAEKACAYLKAKSD
jgi:mono/diheme cytochrome c family protein